MMSMPAERDAVALRVTPAVSDLLNAARWVAAFFVVISHLRLMLFGDYVPSQHGLAWAAFYFVTGFGREAVVVFFVISGLLVGGLTLEKLRTDPQGLSVRRFLIARFSRIYVVLVPTLVLGCLLDHVGRTWFASPGLYGNPSFDWPFGQIFVGNLLLLQDILVPAIGTNGPLWSLAFEWWYYMAFALALLAATAPRRELQMLFIAAFGVLWAVLPRDILVAGGLWAIGVAIAPMVRRRDWSRVPSWLPLAVFALVAMAVHAAAIKKDFGYAGTWVGWAKQAVLAASFAWVVLVAWTRDRVPAPRRAALNDRLAAFSYSLYLTHVPVMDFIASVIQHETGLGLARQSPAPAQLAWFAALLVATYAVAFLFGRLTEDRTAAVRNWMEGLRRG